MNTPLDPVRAWTTRILATVFGAGYSPIAPGTAGTAVPMAIMIIWRPKLGWYAHSWEILAVALAVTLVGVIVSTWGERLWDKEDPGHVCIDEVAGYLVTIAFVPAASELTLLIAGFFAFRMFDIIKPPPARASEKLPGGWGIMIDDIIAGIYSNILLQILATTGLL